MSGVLRRIRGTGKSMEQLAKEAIIAGSIRRRMIRREPVTFEETHPLLTGGSSGKVGILELGQAGKLFYMMEERGDEPIEVDVFATQDAANKAYEKRKEALLSEAHKKETIYFDAKENELQAASNRGRKKQSFKGYWIKATMEVDVGELAKREESLLISGKPHYGLIKCPACGRFGVDARDYVRGAREWAEDQIEGAKEGTLTFLQKNYEQTLDESCVFCRHSIHFSLNVVIDEKWIKKWMKRRA